MRVDGIGSVDYRSRYVPADITEQSESMVSSSDVPPTSDNYEMPIDSAEKQPDEMGKHRLPGRPLAYESRGAVLEWIQNHQHCLILGEAGYGKSALLRYLALSILQPDTAASSALQPTDIARLPVWISFARFASALTENTHLSVEDFFKHWLHQHSFSDICPLFERAVHDKQILLLLDGLDEATSGSSGREALDRIITFHNSCEARIICTSRPRSRIALGLPNTWASSTLVSLSDKQIEMLAMQWFAIVESSNASSHGTSRTFSDQTRSRAQEFICAALDNQKTLELARIPLLCYVLIELFRFSHQLPEARVTAYQEILDLLLSRHPARTCTSGRCRGANGATRHNC